MASQQQPLRETSKSVMQDYIEQLPSKLSSTKATVSRKHRNSITQDKLFYKSFFDENPANHMKNFHDEIHEQR